MTRDQANSALSRLREMREGANAKRLTHLSAARRTLVRLFRHADMFADWTPLDSLSCGYMRGAPSGVLARKAGMVLREIGALKAKGRPDKPVWMMIRLP